MVLELLLWAAAFAGAVSAEGATPLIDAVKSGDRAGVRARLQQKTDVNAAEPDGTTALHWAVRADDLELTRLLLRAGADARRANRYGVTPLQLAAVNGSADRRRGAARGGRRSQRGAARGRNHPDDRGAHGPAARCCGCSSIAAPTSMRARSGTARRRSSGPSPRTTPTPRRCCWSAAPT